MALELLIATVDYIDYIVDGTLRVEQRADAFVSTASFSLLDEDGTLAIKEKDAVEIKDGATTFFAGVIANVDVFNIADGPESLQWEVECQDYNALLEEVVIDSLEQYGAAQDDAIIDDLFDNYLPEIDSHGPGAGGFVQHLHVFAEIEFENITLREAMDRIATEVESVALEGYWYVDYAKFLHYFNIEDNAPAWTLSDSPDQVNSFSYFSDVRKSRQSSALANRILVVGADVALLVQDLDSYAYYGKWFETVVRENTLESVAEILSFGDSLLARWAYPDEVFTVTTYKAGLRAGMNVEFDNTLFGTRTRKNWIENPSFENNATDGWTYWQGGAGGSVAASADRASVGAKSGKLLASDAGGSVIYSDNIALADDETITIQIRLYRAADTGVTLSIYDATNVANRATGNPSLTATWEFLTLSWTNDLAGGPVNVQLRCNNTENDGSSVVYIDACVAEIDKGEYSIEYIDGTLPYCDWTGAAHNSTSTRAPVYTVRQLTITWPQNAAQYKLTLGGKVTSSALISGRMAKDASDAGKGSVVPGQLPKSSRGWSHNLTFSASDHNTVAWDDAKTIELAGGITYTIDGDNTGDMNAVTYIFLDAAVSETVLFTTQDPAAAVGPGRILLAVAEDQAAGMLATVIVYSGGAGTAVLVDTQRIIDGAVTAVKAGTTLQGWSQAVGFSATDKDTVAWAGGNLEMADGTTYAIDPDDTGNMVARTYIYFDLDAAADALQHSIDPADAVGNNKILMAVAEDVADAAKKAYLQAYGGDGTSGIITGDQVVANTITVTELAANSVTTVKLVALNVTGAKIAAATIEAGKLVANTLTASQMAIGGFGDLIFDTAGGLLLLGPRCEISDGSWVSLRSQTATITGAFHQVAGRWQGTKALVVESAGKNWCFNPRMYDANDNGTADSWPGAGNPAGAPTPTVVAHPISPRGWMQRNQYTGLVGDVNTYITHYFDTAAASFAEGDDVTSSVDILVGVGSIAGIRLVVQALTNVGGIIATETSSFTVTTTLTRHEYTFDSLPATTDHIRFRVDITDIDDGETVDYSFGAVNIEKTAFATTFTAGSLGAGYDWDNGDDASTSTRTITQVNLDAHVGLISEKATLSFRVIAQMPYDFDATWSSGNNYLWDTRGADNNNRIILAYITANDTFEVYINGAWRLASGVQDFIASDWKDIVITCDFTADDYNLYINGVLEDNDTTALAAPTLTEWNLGSAYDVSLQFGGAFVEYAAVGKIWTLAEVEALYMLGRPLGDSGAMRSPGIYILDGMFTIASSTGTTRIVINAEEIAGYAAGARQFYIQASDGKAYFSGGDVMLDDAGITLNATNHIKNTIKWKDGAVSYASISSYQDGIAKYLLIKAHSPADTGHTGLVYIVGQGPAGEGDSYIMIVSERVGADGYIDFAVGVGGANVVELKIDDDYVRVQHNLAVEDGLYVGSKNGVPGDDMIYCDSDIRNAGGLSVGSLAVNPDPGDIIATGDIFVGGIIETAYDIGWDLGAAHALFSWEPDYLIRVTLDGNDFDLAALLVE